MTDHYSKDHRDLQDAFESRKLADRLEEMIVKTQMEDPEKTFIEALPMFFLTTVDHTGQPTVSYKGGAPGFVKVVDDTTIAFPSYDGNGMFYSMGNIATTKKVGLLFINFDPAHRLRFHGEASVSKDDPLLADYPEAELVVRVKLTKLWINCPRYIHKMELKELNHYVPGQKDKTPLAGWKRVDLVQDVLPPKDEGRPETEGGIISIEEWVEDVSKGKG